MEENKSTMDVAVALVPIMTYLNRVGIIAVDGCTAQIQLSARKFREIWPDATPDNRGFVTAEYGGHIFTAYYGGEFPNG